MSLLTHDRSVLDSRVMDMHTQPDYYNSNKKLGLKGCGSTAKNEQNHVPWSGVVEVFSCFHVHVLDRFPDLPRPQLRDGSRRLNSHRGKRLSLPLLSSLYTLFTAF